MSNALEMLYLNFRKPFDSLQMLAILCKYLTVGHHFRGFPSGSDGKESACNAGDPGSIPGSERSPWRREWQCTPVFLPGEFHGIRAWWATVHGVTE